ncbi:hypothetical protein BC374_14125 [Ensifer sp. LC13]|nr:hypothetical protein BC362_01040 [Ensifer sp. LC14]OCP12725.1 hypothetical protein BC374_14125 [Ensifer sp. LC13]OCP13427.1 hypothetical protein BBX50_14540 [Ensifer sp. LC11]OCP34168.1 hypothetical protein BC364_12525 [Ensifer sp. LC499]
MAIAPDGSIQLLDEGKGRADVPRAMGLHDAIDSNISVEIVGPSPGEAPTRVVPRAPDLEAIFSRVKPADARPTLSRC